MKLWVFAFLCALLTLTTAHRDHCCCRGRNGGDWERPCNPTNQTIVWTTLTTLVQCSTDSATPLPTVWLTQWSIETDWATVTETVTNTEPCVTNVQTSIPVSTVLTTIFSSSLSTAAVTPNSVVGGSSSAFAVNTSLV